MIIFSPHLDDAVFSCGSLLSRRSATVVTICAGIPDETVDPHAFDRQAGFETAAQAMRCRRREDLMAADVLGFEVDHRGCLEVMYSKEQPIAEAVAEVLAGVASDEPVYGPIGIRHPDHLAVAREFKRVAQQRELNAWLYEELPYGPLFGLDLPPATEELVASPAKFEAIECYSTQLSGIDRAALGAPERYHRL